MTHSIRKVCAFVRTVILFTQFIDVVYASNVVDIHTRLALCINVVYVRLYTPVTRAEGETGYGIV